MIKLEILNPIAFSFIFAPILLILFYFLQGGKEKRKVSSLLFWNSLETDSRSFSIKFQFERDLLFYLQLFIILLLIFALLRPVLTKNVKEVERLIFIIDRSASLQSTDLENDRFSNLKKDILKQINNLSTNTKISLIEADSSPEVIYNFSENNNEIINYINNMESSTEPLDVERTFQLIKMLNNNNEEIYFYSDGAFNLEEEEYINIVNQASFNFIKFGNNVDNIGITNFSIQEKRGLAGQYSTFLEISNFSDENKEVELEVKKERMIILKDRFIINSGDKFRKEYELRSEEKNLFQITLNNKDQFMVDNQIKFHLGDEDNDRFLVAFIGKENYFLERVFLVIPGVRFVKVNNLSDDYYDLYIFNEVNPPENFKQNSIIIKSDNESNDNQVIDIMNWEKDHPIFRFVNFAELQIKNPNYDFISPGSKIVLKSEKGPLMSLVDEENYKKLEIAFSLNNSNLLLQSSFPIFMANLIKWIRPDFMNSNYTKIKTGEVFKYIPFENKLISKVIDPNGNNIDYEKFNQYYYIRNTETEGIYEIELDNGSKVFFSANLLSDKESKLNSSLSKEANNNENNENQRDNIVSYINLWPYLLLIALVLLFIEWIIGVKRGSN